MIVHEAYTVINLKRSNDSNLTNKERHSCTHFHMADTGAQIFDIYIYIKWGPV